MSARPPSSDVRPQTALQPTAAGRGRVRPGLAIVERPSSRPDLPRSSSLNALQSAAGQLPKPAPRLRPNALALPTRPADEVSAAARRQRARASSSATPSPGTPTTPTPGSLGRLPIRSDSLPSSPNLTTWRQTSAPSPVRPRSPVLTRPTQAPAPAAGMPRAPARLAERPAALPRFSRLSQVDDALFISGYDGASSLLELRRAGITHIVNATAEYEDRFPQDFVYLHIRARDKLTERLGPYFEDVAAFVQAAQDRSGRVLVHCQEGISRSAALILATLIINNQQTLDTAFATLQEVRPAIEPAQNFLRELRALEGRLFDGVVSHRRLTLNDVPADDVSDASDTSDELLEALTLLTSKAAISEQVPREDHRRSVQLLRDSDRDALAHSIHDAVYKTFDVYATLDPRAARARAALGRYLNALVAAEVLARSQLTAILQQLFESDAWQDYLEDVPRAPGFARELAAQCFDAGQAK